MPIDTHEAWKRWTLILMGSMVALIMATALLVLSVAVHLILADLDSLVRGIFR